MQEQNTTEQTEDRLGVGRSISIARSLTVRCTVSRESGLPGRAAAPAGGRGEAPHTPHPTPHVDVHSVVFVCALSLTLVKGYTVRLRSPEVYWQCCTDRRTLADRTTVSE